MPLQSRRMGRTALAGLFLICTVGWGCASAPAPAPVAFSPAPTATPTAPIPDPTLDQAEAMLNSGQLDAARDLLVDWLKANPHAPDRDRGIFIMARYYTEIGAMIQAFYQYDELLDNLPDSQLFYRSLENQYSIADMLLNGYKMKFLGLHLINSEDQGIEMMYRIQERSPGSPLAERAMWRTADYYYRTSQFDLASDVYTAYIRSYPRSQLVPRAMLRRAFASLAQFRGGHFDATPLIDARSQFQDIIAKYPPLATEENLNDIVDLIDRTLAAKMLDVAKFYAWTGKPVAAVYTYRSLIGIYPNSSRPRRHEKIWRTCRNGRSPSQPRRPPSRPTPQRRHCRFRALMHRAARPMLAACLLMTAMLCAGCGYSLSNDPGSATADYHNPTLYRKDVKTVAVPIFANHTYYRGIEFTLTKAIINQLETQSPYKVVARDEADTLLEGEIIRIHVQTSSNNVFTGLPQEQLYIVSVDFRWKDLRTGKMLVQRHDFEQTAPYYPTLGESQFYGTQENLEKLALAIVQELQDDWGTDHEDAPTTTVSVP